MASALGNLQIYSKSIAALVLALLVWLNQKFGFALPVDPDTVTLFTGLIIAAGVALAPANKQTVTQAAQTVVDAKSDPAVQAQVAVIQASDKADAKAAAQAAKK